MEGLLRPQSPLLLSFGDTVNFGELGWLMTFCWDGQDGLGKFFNIFSQIIKGQDLIFLWFF